MTLFPCKRAAIILCYAVLTSIREFLKELMWMPMEDSKALRFIILQRLFLKYPFPLRLKNDTLFG